MSMTECTSAWLVHSYCFICCALLNGYGEVTAWCLATCIVLVSMLPSGRALWRKAEVSPSQCPPYRRTFGVESGIQTARDADLTSSTAEIRKCWESWNWQEPRPCVIENIFSQWPEVTFIAIQKAIKKSLDWDQD